MGIVVFIAPPLSGKGTQAEKLELKTAWKHISAGDLLRDYMTNNNDQTAKIIEDIMKQGKFAPEHIVNDVVEDRLAQPDCQNGLILDGYPRTLSQAHHLESLTQKANVAFNGAIHIDVPESELYRRLSVRNRADDKPEILKKRLEDYKNKTMPAVEYYRRKGQLIEIDGSQSLDDVTKDIFKALNLKP